jgi:peptidyl-dipeptidase Dcp
MNILTEKFNTPYHSAPFNSIKNEDYLPAFKELIQNLKKKSMLLSIILKNLLSKMSLKHWLIPGEQLDVVSNIFFNLNSAETSDEIQQIAQEVSPILTEYSSKISQNEAFLIKSKKFMMKRRNIT